MIKLTLFSVVSLFKEEQKERGCSCDSDYEGCPYVRELLFVAGVEAGNQWTGGTP